MRFRGGGGGGESSQPPAGSQSHRFQVRMKKERSPNKPGQSRLELSKQGPDTGQVTPPL